MPHLSVYFLILMPASILILTLLASNMVVADVIPNPPSTNLVKDARAKGCKVIDGLGMLVNQGVIGVKHWTGIDPDPTVMRVLSKKFSNK